jgi:hypothetical protein
MAIQQIPIEAVVQPKSLRMYGNFKTKLPVAGTPTEIPVTLEVYSGWVAYVFAAGDNTRRDQYRTFLPFARNKIMSYPRDDLLDFTVTTSPSVISPEEDEATLFGVEEVSSVRLESQQFDPTDPNQIDFAS